MSETSIPFNPADSPEQPLMSDAQRAADFLEATEDPTFVPTAQELYELNDVAKRLSTGTDDLLPLGKSLSEEVDLKNWLVDDEGIEMATELLKMNYDQAAQLASSTEDSRAQYEKLVRPYRQDGDGETDQLAWKRLQESSLERVFLSDQIIKDNPRLANGHEPAAPQPHTNGDKRGYRRKRGAKLNTHGNNDAESENEANDTVILSTTEDGAPTPADTDNSELAATPEETPEEKKVRLATEAHELIQEMKANPDLTSKDLRKARRAIAQKVRQLKKIDPDTNWDDRFDEHVKPDLDELEDRIKTSKSTEVGEPGQPGRLRRIMAKAKEKLSRNRTEEDDGEGAPAPERGKLRGKASKLIGALAVGKVLKSAKSGWSKLEGAAAVGLVKVQEYYTDKERGKKRIIGTVLGAVAVGVTVAYFTKGASRLDESAPYGPSTVPSVDPNHLNSGGGIKPPEIPQAPAAPVHETATLTHKGDTIWNEVAKHKPNLHGKALHDEVQRTLDANNMSWEDAKHMEVGQEFNLTDLKPSTGGTGQAASEATQHAAPANTSTGPVTPEATQHATDLTPEAAAQSWQVLPTTEALGIYASALAGAGFVGNAAGKAIGKRMASRTLKKAGTSAATVLASRHARSLPPELIAKLREIQEFDEQRDKKKKKQAKAGKN